MNIGDLFDNVREEMSDSQANHFTDSKLVVPFNRLYVKIHNMLIRHGSQFAQKALSILATGTNGYGLGGDVLAIHKMLPHDPPTGSSDYGYGDPLPQVDADGKHHIVAPNATTRVGTPTCFYLWASPPYQNFYFDINATAGLYFTYVYWYKVSNVEAGIVDATTMPYLGLIDEVFHHALVTWARDHREFAPGEEQKWLYEAVNDALMLLGLRKLADREPQASIWKGFEW